MSDPPQTGLDPAHILAICTRATGRRVLAVRKAGGIVVCILPSRRIAYRASTALARVGYQVTSVSAARGRDLLVPGWDPAALESRLTTMRTVLYQLADNPPLTATAVIERFRALPAESRTQQQQWELLNRAHAGLRGWVTTRSGIHALRESTIQPADTGIALRLRAAALLEQGIDDQSERQLRVAGYALALFRQLSGRADGDTAEATAIRWAGITFHLSGPTGRDSSHLFRALPHRLVARSRRTARLPGSRISAFGRRAWHPARPAVQDSPGGSPLSSPAPP